MNQHILDAIIDHLILSRLQETWNTQADDNALHAHSCPDCGATWRHTRNEALAHGYTAAHTCPKCGREVYKRLG